MRTEQTGQSEHRWYKTDEANQPYALYDSTGQWLLLSSPSSFSVYKPAIGGGHRAYDGPFTWFSPPGSGSWSLSNINFSKCSPDAQYEGLPKKNLYLVIENQLPGEPQHWSLFVAPENSPGQCFQVTGDAEKMVYQHLFDVEKFSGEEYFTSFVLAEGVDEGVLEKIRSAAESVPPPQAESKREVRENYQGWSMVQAI